MKNILSCQWVAVFPVLFFTLLIFGVVPSQAFAAGKGRQMSAKECHAIFDRNLEILRKLLQPGKQGTPKTAGFLQILEKQRKSYVSGCRKLKRSELLALARTHAATGIAFKNISGVKISRPVKDKLNVPLKLKENERTMIHETVEIRLKGENLVHVRLLRREAVVKNIRVNKKATVKEVIRAYRSLSILPGTRVIIRSDANTAYKAVIATMDAMTRLQIKNVSVATRAVKKAGVGKTKNSRQRSE